MSNIVSSDLMDLISKMAGEGSRSEGIAEQLYGFNSLGTQSTIPLNRDHHGFVFFTRPRLNLTTENVRFEETFPPLLAVNGDRNTLGMMVRSLLDPPGVYRGDDSPLADPRQAFIPWLTTSIQSCSGWPDLSSGTYISEEGNYHEQWGMLDDTLEYFRSWPMSANFRDMIGQLIPLLFYVWVKYGTNVYEGVMRPYPDADIENEIDYISRCIRFRTDESRRRITEWGSTLCFPKSIPTGVGMNFSADAPINDEGRTHTINFDCFGFEWNHPATLKEFNVIVEHFNVDMSDRFRNTRMRKLHSTEWALFNHHIYFRVDLATNELERWVDKDYYDFVSTQITSLYR